MSNFGVTKTMTAIVPHQCDECGRTIAVAERYHRHVGVWEGEFFINVSCDHCAVCRKIVDAVDNGYFEVYYGGLGTWMGERMWREPFADIFGNQVAVLLRLAVGYRMRWHHQISGRLMSIPAMPDRLSPL